MPAPGRRAAVVVIATLHAFLAAVMPGNAGAAVSGPEASATAATSLTAPDARVAEAQALMAELGLWNGAADGRASAAFGQAVRRARGVMGLPPDALQPIDDALLSALRSQAEARRTARQLDDARAREEAAARAAIAASPVLSEALRPAPDQDPADAEACRSAPSPECLLDAARQAVVAVSDGELRNWGLARVARARVAASGRLDDAWPALRLADDPRAVFTALSGIATDAARAGRPDLARAAVAVLTGLPPTAATAAAEAAAPLAEEAPAAARVLAEQAHALLPAVPEPADRRAVLAGLARAAQAMGDAGAARALLEQASGAPETLAPVWAEVSGAAAVAPLLDALPADADPAARRALLMELAEAYGREGAVGPALEAAEAVEEPRYRAVALARVAGAGGRADLLERAEAVAEGITLPFARAFALSQVAEAWLALNRPARALAVAQGIDTDTLAVEALDRIARHRAAPPEVASQARRAADARLGAMIDRVSRVRLWAERARALAATDPAAAGRAAREAVSQALSVRDRWNAARALLHAAEAVTALQASGVDVAPLDADVEGGGAR